jgi:signal transduction histidine kinase
MPCSIGEILYELVEGFRLKADQKNILITINLPKMLPPTVLIDKQQFERAVSNLLDNAIKYSPEESEVMVPSSLKSETRATGYPRKTCLIFSNTFIAAKTRPARWQEPD